MGVKYAFIADVHVGNMKQHGGAVKVGCNARAQEVIQVLRRCATKAKELGCEKLVVLGDLFDISNPNPQMVTQVAAALSVGPPVEIIVGNHDQVSTDLGDHALAPFTMSNKLQVHEVPKRVGDLVLIPFQPGPACDWLPESLKQVDCEGGVLCIHLGIEGATTPFFLKGAHDSIKVEQLKALMDEHKLRACFAGNWHNAMLWPEDKIWQCGTICPKSFSDDGLDYRGLLWVYEPEHWLVEEPDSYDIPGPRFLKMDVDELDDRTGDLEALAQKGYSIFVRATAEPDEIDEVKSLKEGAPDGITIEVALDATEAKAAVKSAAVCARSAETFEEALHKYIDQFPIEAPGTKEGVLERIRQFRRFGT